MRISKSKHALLILAVLSVALAAVLIGTLARPSPGPTEQAYLRPEACLVVRQRAADKIIEQLPSGCLARIVERRGDYVVVTPGLLVHETGVIAVVR